MGTVKIRNKQNVTVSRYCDFLCLHVYREGIRFQYLHRLPCANDYAISELFTILMLLIPALDLTATS
jgi:hypothetical protein